jgi:hypothetical protein
VANYGGKPWIVIDLNGDQTVVLNANTELDPENETVG